MDVRDKFENSFIKQPSGCWEWQLAKRGNGYGVFYSWDLLPDRRSHSAHRVSMHLYKGFDLGSNLCVMHSCDNPCCVNPDHLTAVDRQHNIRDMVAKGRAGQRKLTKEECELAVKWRSEGMTTYKIGERLGISQGQASRVSRGQYHVNF